MRKDQFSQQVMNQNNFCLLYNFKTIFHFLFEIHLLIRKRKKILKKVKVHATKIARMTVSITRHARTKL